MIRPSALFRPWILLIGPVLMSFLAWSVPGSGTFLRGFAVRSDLSWSAAFVLGSWYLVCVLVISFGVAVGRSLKPTSGLSAVADEPGFERAFYRLLTLFSLVGVGGAYWLVTRQTSIVEALSSEQANLLSTALLDGSSIGTLRYVASVAAPIGVILSIERRSSWILAGINVVLLFGVVLLSSRLSLIMATAIFAFLYYQRRPDARLRLRVLVPAVALLFALLALFNYTRNAGYYRSLGVDNPYLMNVYQILSYVGAPSQVSVGVADAIAGGRFPRPIGPVDALQAIVPTFLQSQKGDKSAAVDLGLYAYQVDIAPNLNANSSFADVYAMYGWWGLAYTLLILGIAAALFEHFRKYTSVVAVLSGVVGYGFLEYWRGYLFNTGNIVFLILAISLCAWAARLVVGTRRPSAPPPGTPARIIQENLG